MRVEAGEEDTVAAFTYSDGRTITVENGELRVTLGAVYHAWDEEWIAAMAELWRQKEKKRDE